MQFLMNFGLLALFAVVVSAGASKFADTCNNINGSGTTLRADCREYKNGQFRSTTLDLNRCIKNNKGGLQVRLPRILDQDIRTNFALVQEEVSS